LGELFRAGTQAPHTKPHLKIKTRFGITAPEGGQWPESSLILPLALSVPNAFSLLIYIYLPSVINFIPCFFSSFLTFLSCYRPFVLPSLFSLVFSWFPSHSVLTFILSQLSRMRTALFWAITQCVVVIPSRRFGTTYRSHLQGSRIGWVVPKRRDGITTTRCIIAQKSAVLIYFAAEV